MSAQLFHEIGVEFENKYAITTGQMFGKQCLKIHKKAFAALFKNEMVFKLGQQEVSLLKEKYPNSINWDPSGKNRPMKDWLQIPSDYSHDWEGLAKLALRYVQAIP